MNVERWLKSRRVAWQRLEELLRVVDRKGFAALDRQQLQELGRLYRSASADLSRARAMKLGQDLQVYLNNLVVKAHNQVYQKRTNRWLALINFLYAGFPRLVRENILYVLAAFTIFAIPGGLSYYMTLQDITFAQL